MRKVLMIAPTPFFADRGCHVRIYEEYKALAKLNWRIKLVTYHLGRDLPGIETIRIRNHPRYTKLSAGPSIYKVYLDCFIVEKALEAGLEFKPDIIHAHLHEGCAAGAILKRVVERPLIFDYQGGLSHEAVNHGFVRDGSLPFKGLRALERLVNAQADRVIFSSTHLLKDYLGQADPARLRVMCDGVDPELFRPWGRDESLADSLGLPRGKPLVGFLGLLNSYQGADVLLKAISVLKRDGADAHFLMMGYPDEDLYMSKAAALGVGGMTTFPGMVDYFKAANFLSLCDIAVAPKISRTESNGKVLNYMACGLPVAAFDTAVNRELLGDDAEYAKLTDDLERSAEELAGALARLIESPDKRKLLAQAGLVKARGEFRWDRIIRGLTDIYDELAD